MSARGILRWLKVLRRYVPDNLFAEEKLPQIRIYREGKKDPIAFEDPSLVISAAGYLPGRPTYREGTGLFIPLRSLPSLSEDVKPIITNINGYYSLSEPIPVRFETLPDEYQYIVREILKRKYIDARTIDSIYTKLFECKEHYEEKDRKLLHRWLFYSCVKRNFTCDELSKKYKSYKFYAYLDSSSSFPRFFTYQFQTEPASRLKIPCSSLREIIRDISLYENSNVYFGIYAIDVNANIEGRFCEERNEENQSRCIVVNTIKGPDSKCSCVKAQGLRYFNNFVKVFIRSDKNGLWDPVTIGYRINNTRVLEIVLDYGRIMERFECIMRRINDDRSRKLKPSYYELSINTALVNLLKHILTSDLPIVYYFELMGSVKTAELIKLAFLYHELRSSINITELIYNANDAKPIINVVRSFIDNYNDDLAILLRYFMSKLGRNSKLITLLMDMKKANKVNNSNLLQKITDRLQNILDKYRDVGNGDWKFGAIFDFVRHTFSHHLIRTISTRGGVMAGKFLEQYEELSTDPIKIVERDSGGVGVIRADRSTLTIWKNDETLIEDLLLSLGKCLVGTPEDLIHFAIVKRRNELYKLMVNKGLNAVVELKRVFKGVADDLGIIVTPDELEETVRQWFSIFEEASRMRKLINRTSRDTEYKVALDVLWEIHDIRHNFEKRYRRFPEFDELVIYTIANLYQYGNLASLINYLLRQALNTRGLINALKNIYPVSNVEERFTRDASSLLKLLKEKKEMSDEQRAIIDCLRRKEGVYVRGREIDCEGVRSSLILLRKVVFSVLVRLALLSCNGACGMCYVNTKSCGRFGASFIQARTLDRRLLKILATGIVESLGEAGGGCGAGSTCDGGVVVEFGGKTYRLGCGK